MTEEKRIYVIVAETVATDAGVVTQPAGRIAAQCAHVVSKMHMKQMAQKNMKKLWSGQGITTIVLSVPNSSALETLLQSEGTCFEKFEDSNREAYGSGRRVITAICTHPTSKSRLKGRLDHLPLWNPEERMSQFPVREEADYTKEDIRLASANAAIEAANRLIGYGGLGLSEENTSRLGFLIQSFLSDAMEPKQ